MGDCFYVLTVPMEGLINTHSMGTVRSYHTELKTHCKADLIVYVSVFLFGALKDANKTSWGRCDAIWHRDWTTAIALEIYRSFSF